mmetsp:Transcript_18678/g.59520  ORF Transcript_18678/g.59520 Transcript_18678/m.59520 type:complete len:224 (+) Transcript_18678:185-856(+)
MRGQEAVRALFQWRIAGYSRAGWCPAQPRRPRRRSSLQPPPSARIATHRCPNRRPIHARRKTEREVWWSAERVFLPTATADRSGCTCFGTWAALWTTCIPCASWRARRRAWRRRWARLRAHTRTLLGCSSASTCNRRRWPLARVPRQEAQLVLATATVMSMASVVSAAAVAPAASCCPRRGAPSPPRGRQGCVALEGPRRRPVARCCTTEAQDAQAPAWARTR